MTLQLPKLLFHPDFRSLWLSQTVSQLGSAITRFALPIVAIITLEATPAQMGLLRGLEFVPFLALGLIAGAWADRFVRRPILILTDLGRFILLSSVPVMSVLGYLSIEYLYFIGLSTGILNVFFDVSCQSFLPSLVRRDQLMEGNNLLSISESAANLVGPGIAGCLVKLVAAQEAIAFDALSFLTSAVLLGLIRTPEKIQISTGRTNIWSEIGEGLRYLWKNQLLRAIALSTSTYNLFYNISMSVYIIHVTRNLGIEPNVLGILLAIGGLGTLLGSFTVQRITNTIGIGATLIGATLIGGIGAIFIPLSSSFEAFAAPMLVIAGFLEGLCDVIYNINEATLRQSLMPLSLQGRTNASLRWLYWGIFPIGSLLGGMMGETIGVRNTLWIGASGTLLATAWVFFSPIRWLEKLPLPIVD